MRWSRVQAGHYCTRRWNDERKGYDQIHIINYAPRDWELKINGEHRGYGTKGQLQETAERIYAGGHHIFDEKGNRR